MKLDSNNHSVFLMCYHLVLVVKYRRKIFDAEISDFSKGMFVEIGIKYNITLVEWNHDNDNDHEWVYTISRMLSSKTMHHTRSSSVHILT